MRYFQSEMDYIFFFYGLSFILLAAVCFLLKNKTKENPAWGWLALFGLLHGLNEWLDLIALTFSDSFVFAALRAAIMAASFIFLLEFGRKSLIKTGGKPPGPAIYAPLLLLAGLGAYYGLNGLNGSVRYALGLTGGLLSALALYRAAAGRSACLRAPLLVISAALWLYALTSGGVVPQSALLPARWINQGSFAAFFGFPVQLLRGLLAMTAAISAWVYFLNLGEKECSLAARTHKARAGSAAIAAFLFTIVAGWVLTAQIGGRAMDAVSRDSEAHEKMLSARLQAIMRISGQAADALSGEILLQGALSGGGADKANSELDRYCSTFDLSVCYLMNLTGVTIASSNRNSPDSFLGKDYSFRPYFKAAAAGTPDFYLARGATSGKIGYYASSPVKKDGRIIGVVAIKNNLAPLAEEMGGFSRAFLVSPEGLALISKEGELHPHALWPTTPQAKKRLAASGQFGRPDFHPLLNTEPQDDQVLQLAGKQFYVSRAFSGNGQWSLLGLSPLIPVHMARLAAIAIVFSVCLLILGFFVMLVKSAEARETAENLLALKEELNTLSGIVPICASCKKIRDDSGYWTRVETYVARHSEAQFSHGLCPDCARKLYPEYSDNPDKPEDK